MTDSDAPHAVEPEIVDEDGAPSGEATISEPTKLIRMASMTRALLEELRHAPTDEPSRRRLLEIHERSIQQMRAVLSDDLKQELDGVLLPLAGGGGPPSESELRIAQSQLVGWLEGLFHGIQASLFSQQMAAQHQLEQMRGAVDGGGRPEAPGAYL